MEVAVAENDRKVFVVVPAEPRAGRSTLSWALGHLCGGATTVVVTHVHVPPQMIPISTCVRSFISEYIHLRRCEN